VNNALAAKFNVAGYPALKMVFGSSHGRGPTDVKSRSAKGMAAMLRKASRPLVSRFGHIEETRKFLNSASDVALVMLTSKYVDNTQYTNTFQTLATDNLDVVNIMFGQLDVTDIMAQKKLSLKQVVQHLAYEPPLEEPEVMDPPPTSSHMSRLGGHTLIGSITEGLPAVLLTTKYDGGTLRTVSFSDLADKNQTLAGWVDEHSVALLTEYTVDQSKKLFAHPLKRHLMLFAPKIAQTALDQIGKQTGTKVTDVNYAALKSGIAQAAGQIRDQVCTTIVPVYQEGVGESKAYAQ
jgi:hypothetical protein